MKVSHPLHLADEDDKMTMKTGALLILAELGCFVAFNGLVAQIGELSSQVVI